MIEIIDNLLFLICHTELVEVLSKENKTDIILI